MKKAFKVSDKTIGIPRAMSFYHDYPFYHGFFAALGIKVVLSDSTTKQTLNEGSKLVVSETCLPVKIYIGHVLNLLDKGVDKILVPSMQSVAHKVYNCSKIRGLPDLVRNVIKKDFTIVEAVLDKSEKNNGFYEFLSEVARYYGIRDKAKIKKASKAGWRVYNNFKMMMKSGMHYEKAMNYALSGKVFIEERTKEHPISIAIVSHGYNIYDERASMKVFDKLEGMDVRVFSALQLSDEQMNDGLRMLSQGLYWANECEMSGAAGFYLKDTRVDGLVTISAFGCGPDSLMIERITRKAKQFSKPVLNLTIDEHTGEAGFITRIEAFVDMLYRQKRARLVDIDLRANEISGLGVGTENFIEARGDDWREGAQNSFSDGVDIA